MLLWFPSVCENFIYYGFVGAQKLYYCYCGSRRCTKTSLLLLWFSSVYENFIIVIMVHWNSPYPDSCCVTLESFSVKIFLHNRNLNPKIFVKKFYLGIYLSLLHHLEAIYVHSSSKNYIIYIFKNVTYILLKITLINFIMGH